MRTAGRGLRSSNGRRLVLAGSGSILRTSRVGLSVRAEAMDGHRWEFRSSYALRRSYQAVERPRSEAEADAGGDGAETDSGKGGAAEVVGEFSRPLTLGRNGPFLWYGHELGFRPTSLLRKDWTLSDVEGREILDVHAHAMFGKNKVTLRGRDDATNSIPHMDGLELFCVWLATRFSLERIRAAGA